MSKNEMNHKKKVRRRVNKKNAKVLFDKYELYRKAVQIVAESQKASTSYIQRQLRIGYNSAARLIERMENDGKVSRPDHVGRREVLIDTNGQAV